MHEPIVSQRPQAPVSRLRWLWFVLAWICVGLGILGIVLPGLPTTPFMLLAAGFAAKGSPRLRQRLLDHALFGPAIRDWEASGAVSRRAKRVAISTMVLCGLVLWLINVPRWSLYCSLGAMSVVAVWLWRRPEPLNVALDPATTKPDD